jgi:hypothetical protein
MRTLALIPFLPIVFAIGSLLAGCGESSGVQPPSSRAASEHSWMLPGAAGGDLMYVADASDNRVDVFTYPAAKLVGGLTGFQGLAFMCVDTAGHIFIPNYGLSEILEYAHGGKSPIATLKDPRATPYSCSVDSMTGNLAVANYVTDGGLLGDVVIYSHARGRPKTYEAYASAHDYFCAYDNAGDLFVEGSSPAASGGNFAIEELPKGGRGFGPVALQNIPAYPNGLQWAGTYLAVGTGTLAGPSSGDTYIYHMQISQFIAKTIGTTQLQGDGPTANFFIDGSTIIVSGGETQPRLGFFPYPQGGSPTKTLKETSPYGVVVSAAAH